MTDPKNAADAVSCAIEAAFRRGYMRGYFAAADDTEKLVLRGYRRPTEIVNLLDFWAERLIPWRHSEDDLDQQTPPPKLDIPSWPELRRQVFARDGRVCGGCQSRRQLEIDHVKPVAEGGLPVLENLRVLCRDCNRAHPRSRWVVR